MVKHVKLFSVLVSVVLYFGGLQTASAGSTAANDQGTANNLVTQQSASAASAQIAGLVGSAVSNVVAPPPAIPAGGAPSTTSQKGGSTMYFDSRQLGLAAGKNPKFGAWIQGGFTSIEGDDTGGEFDGDVINFLVGFDYKVRPKSVVGVAVGYESLDLDTTFNTGTFEGDGIGITPYFGAALSDKWSVQVLGGYTSIEYDTTSGGGATTSSFDADRIFGSGSLVGSFRLTDKIAASPKVSVLYLTESQDGFTDSAGTAVPETTIDLGRASFGGTISYLAGSVTPFVRLLGEYDFVQEDAVNLGGGNFSSNDEFGLNATVGLGLNFKNGWTGNLEATSATLLRDNLDVYTFSGRLRYTW